MWARVGARVQASRGHCVSRSSRCDTDNTALHFLKIIFLGRKVQKFRSGDSCGPWAESWRVVFRRLGTGETPADAGLP